MEFLQHNMNWVWLLTLVSSGTLLLIPSLRARLGGPAVSPAQATLMINREDAIVIDVRDQDEWDSGHIANARHIPLSKLDERLHEVEKYKQRTVLVNCRSGHRSGMAASRMRKAGFEKVFNLEGGILAWQQAGLPLSKKAS